MPIEIFKYEPVIPNSLEKLILKSKIGGIDFDVLSRYTEVGNIKGIAFLPPKITFDPKKGNFHDYLAHCGKVIAKSNLRPATPWELVAISKDMAEIVEKRGVVWSKFTIEKGGKKLFIKLHWSGNQVHFSTGTERKAARHPFFVMVTETLP